MLRCGAVDRHGDDDTTTPPDEGVAAARAADAALVDAARSGDERAFGRLFDQWFDPVFDVAWRILRDQGTAAEVAQDVFLVAWQRLGDLEQPGSFGGWVRRIARNRALNRLDRERRSRPDSEAVAARLDRSAPDVDMTAALGEREQNELVWAAAAALGERDTSLLDLHLRHGLSAPEIATELGVTPNNAHQLLHRLKGKLGGAIRAWVLWRGGGTPCAGLDRAVADAGLTTFGAEAVRVVDRHARDCATCEERRELRLAPEALFAVVPIGVAPPILKAEAASALAQAGVSMSGSSAIGGGAAGSGDASSPGDAARSSDTGSEAAGTESTGAGDTGIESAGSGEPGGPGDPSDAPADAPTDRMAATDAPELPPVTPRGTEAPAARARRRALALVGLLVAMLLAGAGVLLTADDPDEVATSESEATASSGPATAVVTAPPTTAAATAPSPSASVPATTTPDEPAVTTTRPDGTGAVTTTAPSVVPPPAPPEPPPPPAPAPVIGGFRGTRTGTPCGSASTTTEVTLVWQSTNADSAAIAGVGSGLPASGSATVCAGPGVTYTLTVTGPGGTDTATTPTL